MVQCYTRPRVVWYRYLELLATLAPAWYRYLEHLATLAPAA